MSTTTTCDGVRADAPVPLVALLGNGEAAFVAEFDRRIRETEFCALSLAHSRNVLRHLGDGPQRASQIVSACDVSKQAISQQVAHLEANGYVELSRDEADHRARVITLTDKGVRAQLLVRHLFAQIEQDWAERIGTRDAASLRRILAKLVTTVPGRC